MAQRLRALVAFLDVLNLILNPGSLQEQQVLLTTEETLQPPMTTGKAECWEKMYVTKENLKLIVCLVAVLPCFAVAAVLVVY